VRSQDFAGDVASSEGDAASTIARGGASSPSRKDRRPCDSARVRNYARQRGKFMLESLMETKLETFTPSGRGKLEVEDVGSDSTVISTMMKT
jgi:hypothetical protein